ncbi:thioredoxin domain-containing protein PLP3B-like [Zingiber officinale]|uniref:thioredoxin domain-containing protein PLP3B-like n=1 Tax=Zingiber officinale TaxID=94328 RepID=UPI001C4B7E2C|nr:thioredoxin domain-containing protein PLP3B-like [Zingiber officinale]
MRCDRSWQNVYKIIFMSRCVQVYCCNALKNINVQTRTLAIGSVRPKHLKALAPVHINTKFIKLDAENAPFFVTKLAIKTLPCVILFRNDIAFDRIVGFQDLGSKDDFTARALENLLKRKGGYRTVEISTLRSIWIQ